MKRNVAILIFDDVQTLDFAGPFEVFSDADQVCAHEAFHTFTFSLGPGSVRARHGLKLVPDFTLEHCPAPQVLVVPGGNGTRALLQMPALLEWLRIRARSAEVVLSVCTGALVLAQAGLLDGLRATTHHGALDRLRQLAPRAEVVDNERFVDNGALVTAAGISAGIDASLHVVGRLLGPAVADATARQMEYRHI